MPAPLGRIVFPNSPWPRGHAITTFTWSARLMPVSGIWFDFHLKTADYDAEDPGLDNPDSTDLAGWDSTIVWNNYAHCTLSSTYWAAEAIRGEDLGVLAATISAPLNIRKPLDLTCDTDLSDPYGHPRPFGIYLLGHDTAADHRIRIHPNAGGRTHRITWTGQIALVYGGDPQFKHHFEAVIPEATIEGIRCPAGMDASSAHATATSLLIHPTDFVPTTRDGVTWLQCQPS